MNATGDSPRRPAQQEGEGPRRRSACVANEKGLRRRRRRTEKEDREGNEKKKKKKGSGRFRCNKGRGRRGDCSRPAPGPVGIEFEAAGVQRRSERQGDLRGVQVLYKKEKRNKKEESGAGIDRRSRSSPVHRIRTSRGLGEVAPRPAQKEGPVPSPLSWRRQSFGVGAKRRKGEGGEGVRGLKREPGPGCVPTSVCSRPSASSSLLRGRGGSERTHRRCRGHHGLSLGTEDREGRV